MDVKLPITPITPPRHPTKKAKSNDGSPVDRTVTNGNMATTPPNSTEIAESGYAGDVENDPARLTSPPDTIRTESNDFLRPRCEFYSRYKHTSIYPNPNLNPKRLRHYSRSDDSPHYRGASAAEKKEIKFIPVPLTSAKKQDSLEAHTGGFANPYHLKKYADKIRPEQADASTPSVSSLVYDDILAYKKQICKYIADKYQKHADRRGGMVIYANEYPCILVQFNYRTDDKNVEKKDLDKFYERYNYMLTSYLIAIVDYLAFKQGIYIEMLGRSSFGHNNPTVDVTKISFRINVGLIPKVYADIIVDGLIKLYNLFKLIEETDEHLLMDSQLRAELNDGRLENKVDKKKDKSFDAPELPYTYWEALWVKGSRGKQGKIMISELFERDGYRAELLTNLVLNTLQTHGWIFFQDPQLAEEPIAEMFRYIQYGSSYTVTVIQEEEHKDKKQPAQKSTTQTKRKKSPSIRYDKIANRYYNNDTELKLRGNISNRQYSKFVEDVKSGKSIPHSTFASIFANFVDDRDAGKISGVKIKTALGKNNADMLQSNPDEPPMSKEMDEDFYRILNTVFNALGIELAPEMKLSEVYWRLEQANLKFIQHPKTLKTQEQPTDDWGSDSNNDDDNKFKLDFKLEESVDIKCSVDVYVKKVIVANGMLAINLAYYAARIGILHQDNSSKTDFQPDLASRKWYVNIDNTYFEVSDCLKYADNPPQVVSENGKQKAKKVISENDKQKAKKVISENDKQKAKKVDILFFDLNSFHAGYINRKIDLKSKLKNHNPQIVVLDHTSSTSTQVRDAINQIFLYSTIQLIILVSSGLKNEQAGADNNPYGKLTIVARKKELREIVYDSIKSLTNKPLLVEKPSDTQTLDESSESDGSDGSDGSDESDESDESGESNEPDTNNAGSKDSGTKPKVADSSRLSSMALLPPKAHAIRRFYKARRIAPTSRDLLQPTSHDDKLVDWQSITKTIRTFLLQTTNGKNQNDKNAINNKKQQIYELLVEDFINNRKQLNDKTPKELKTKFRDAQPNDDVQVLIANCKEDGKFDEEIIHFIVEYLAYLSKNDVKKLMSTEIFIALDIIEDRLIKIIADTYYYQTPSEYEEAHKYYEKSEKILRDIHGEKIP